MYASLFLKGALINLKELFGRGHVFSFVGTRRTLDGGPRIGGSRVKLSFSILARLSDKDDYTRCKHGALNALTTGGGAPH